MNLFEKAGERFKKEAKKAKKKMQGVEVAKWTTISSALEVLGDIMIDIHNEEIKEAIDKANKEVKECSPEAKEERKDYKKLRKEETKKKLSSK